MNHRRALRNAAVAFAIGFVLCLILQKLLHVPALPAVFVSIVIASLAPLWIFDEA